MKMNKKIIVPFLSTVIGISMAAGIGGAFAWYQYNSQVTASFVGSSVADSTLLQIGHKVTTIDEQSQQSVTTMDWGRDYYVYGSNKPKLVPVTFGQLLDDTTDQSNPKHLILPNNGEYAYGYPEAGKSNGYSDWTHVGKNNADGTQKGFSQYTIYLRALNVDGSPKALDVYLSDITIESVATDSHAEKSIVDAVRIHLNVEDNKYNKLISKSAIVADPNHDPEPYEGLDLFGPLDLDGDGADDKQTGYSWEGQGSTLTYGVAGQHQTTIGTTAKGQSETDAAYRTRVNEDSTVATVVREADGTIATNAAKKICTTKITTTNTDADYVKIVVTVWLEGWAVLKTGQTSPEAPAEPEDITSAVWNPQFSAGVDVRVGMTFDTGKVA